MPTITQLKTRAKQALSGKFLRVSLLFAFVLLFEEAFGLNLVLESFFMKIEKHVLSLYGYQYTISNTVPIGAIGEILFILTELFTLTSLVCKVGEIRAAHALLTGGDPSLKTFFPMRLLLKVILMNIIRAVLIFAWSMLFVFPGIIAAYRYSMAEHMLAEEPELSAVEALRESRIRMHGHKMQLFALQLSFLGWILLLRMLTCGLAPLAEPFELMNAMTPVNLNLTTHIGVLDIGLFPRLIEALHMSPFVAELIVGAITILLTAGLTAYQETTTTAFYESIPEPQGQGGAVFEAEQPSADEEKSAFEAEKAEEEAAKTDALKDAEELYTAYKCSKRLMEKAGVLGEYEATGATAFNEDIWQRDYTQRLMRRFDRDPGALDELLALCDEYALDGLLDRVIERIARHLRQQSLTAMETLDMLGCALTTLTGKAFADNPGFVARKKERLRDMAENLEARLEAEDPEGSWRDRLNAVKGMCV